MWSTESTTLDGQLGLNVRKSSLLALRKRLQVCPRREEGMVASSMGIMTAAKDWKVLVDLDKQLKFPQEVQVQTTQRPDLITSLCTRSNGSSGGSSPAQKKKISLMLIIGSKYADLQVDCQTAGWSCYNVAIEVGARGFAAESLQRAATAIGIRGRAVKKLVREAGQEAMHCSRWIYWLSEKKEWETRNVA